MWGVDGLLYDSIHISDFYKMREYEPSYSVLRLLRSQMGIRSSRKQVFLRSVPSLHSCTTLCIADAELATEVCPLISHLISSCPSLAHLYLYLPSLSLEETHLLRKAVLAQCHHGSLQSLIIGANICPESCLLPLLTSTMARSLKTLSISLDRSPGSCELVQSISLQLTHNTISTLRSFSLIDQEASNHLDKEIYFKMLCSMLEHNTSLTSFTLYKARFEEADSIRHLFKSLQMNWRLTFLSLDNCSIFQGFWPIAAILDCLRVNTTLCELDFTGTGLQYLDEITAQLLRNKENSERMKVLRSTLVRPTTVRLFLCGMPYSGKTTLCRSLANWNRRASLLSRARSTRKPKRTSGIEVTTLEKGVGDKHQRILLWDMAGQTEFHSFHDSMFPDLSNRATPSMFLFIWNPFEINTKGNIQLDSRSPRRKDVQKFTDEFKYWLRFIASKAMKSEDFKPKVLVAITRADLGSDDRRLWLKRDFTALQEQFQDIIQFNEKDFFHLNAKDHLQSEQLGLHVFDCAKAILQQLPDVFQACADAREVLGNMVHNNQIPPLITKEKFHQLCEKELHLDTQEMREAVALSLSDSGDLIYFKSLELVVVDTQWFCHKIMGDLLNDIMAKESFAGDAFIPVDALEALLDRIVNSRVSGSLKLVNIRAPYKRFESMKVEGRDLVKLLVGLQLACLEDNVDPNNSRIFLAIGLSGKAKRTLFPSNCLISDRMMVTTYLGRRLSCQNIKCTFLTPMLFPLLQVTFHKLFHDREVPVRVRLEEDVMAFALDGVKVLMEFCTLEGKDHFIDILVCSSKSLDDTIEWLQENVMLEVERVCREPRGNQGVELAHAIIQPACIENFLEASRRPAVLVKELQDKLKKEVEKKGVNDGRIKSAQYTWQIDSSPADSLVDLLGNVETVKVIQTYLRSLRDAEREISHLFAEKVETSQPQKPQLFGMSQSSKDTEILYLYDRFCETQQNVMIEIKDLGNAIQGFRNAVLPKLSKLFTFVNEGEASKLPRIPLVTQDDGIVRRMVSAIVPGLQNIRLHLLCECRSEPQHLVDGKEGLSLATLDDGLLRRGLPYINALLKAAYVAAKVGGHAAIGFGNSIPDFTKVLAYTKFDGFPALTNLTSDWNSSSRVDFKEGQQWLFDVLSNCDCIKGHQIHARFGLHRVRLGDSTAAWVCDKHYAQEGTPWPS